MKLYETDKEIFSEFLRKNNKDYHDLILYNFATDLKYSEEIQKDLFQYIKPFYLRNIIEMQSKNGNKNSKLIGNEFNDALFINKNAIIKVIGIECYNKLLHEFLKILIKKINNNKNLEWVSLFNTFIALNNTIELNRESFWNYLNIEGKYSMFLFFSVFLFSEKENLFYKETKMCYESTLFYEFQSNSSCFYWREVNMKIFNNFLEYTFFKKLYIELESYIDLRLNKVDMELFFFTMNEDFNIQKFNFRKKKFLGDMMNINRSNFWFDYMS